MENKVSNFININTKEKYDGKILVIINSFYPSTSHDIAINIYNKLKTIRNEFYTIIINHCTGISFIPFLAAKKENRFSLKDAKLLLYYKELSSNISDNYYKKFEYELISKETNISELTLKNVFIDKRFKLISSNFFEDYQIAKVINNFTELPIQLHRYEIIENDKTN